MCFIFIVCYNQFINRPRNINQTPAGYLLQYFKEKDIPERPGSVHENAVELV